METPNNPTSIEHRIREGLSRLATAMRSDDWARAKAAGINPTQYAILELLEGRPHGLGVKEIALRLGVSQPTATDSILALERKSLVMKQTAVEDRRATHVLLTEPGRAALAAGEAVHGTAEIATEPLSSAERTRLLMTLVTMIQQLQETGAIPIQRMCVSCRHFRPNVHPGEANPHHCAFVDAAFGQSELRIDCRDHEIADPAFRAATWNAFIEG